MTAGTTLRLVVQARSLVKDYEGLRALDGVDFQAFGAELVVLAGANGSGKSSLLKVLAGLAEQTSGEVSVLGARPGSLEARSVTSYIGDHPVLYEDLSVEEHLYYISRLHGGDGLEAGRLMELLGLSSWAGALPAKLSRGLRQKTAIALAFVRPFRLLLADEPSLGLDRVGKEGFGKLLDEAASEGAAVVVATHDPDLVRRADRLVVLRDGSVEYEGPPDANRISAIVG